ncbi:hypothetical protein OIU76_013117 [Salix suchowensis]|nr:hypothetical protein OIU76_013117 [Salix suchowensis]
MGWPFDLSEFKHGRIFQEALKSFRVSESHTPICRADHKLPLMACRLLISCITTAVALLLIVSRTLQGFQISTTMISGMRKLILYMIMSSTSPSTMDRGLDVRNRVTRKQDPNSIQLPRGQGSIRTQHEINRGSARDFTFRN